MAAFHFTAKILSRSGGARSAVRAAAYRAGEKLHDERTGECADYTRKQDVYRTEIIAPEGAPGWAHDRGELWNRVESRERRKDAQLAQEFELNLPRELSPAENWRIVTDFVRRELVAKGRVADVAMHCAKASDGEAHPHAHILMPMRVFAGDALGEKHPDVDRKTFFQNKHRIEELREAWCVFVRERAAERGIDLGPDWDHRSLDARELNLEAQPKIGGTSARLEQQGLAAGRVAEFKETLARNGERLLADPTIALKALTAHVSTFTDHDLARWIHRHSTESQFANILTKARAEAVVVGRDEYGHTRYSTTEMVEIERRMMADAEAMSARSGHVVRDDRSNPVRDASLSGEQRAAAGHLLEAGDLASLVGYAGAGKSTMLAKVREAYAAQGYRVVGGALSGIAAQNLEQGSGIEARTLASWSHAWAKGKDTLSSGDILVIDEAGMIGSRQLAHVLRHARDAGAKVILVGDAEQLQAIEAGAAFRVVTSRLGAAELTQVHRQTARWQRDATRDLATGRTAHALRRYAENGSILAVDTHSDAREAIVQRWMAGSAAQPGASQLILAHTRADVAHINDSIRERRRAAGELGPDTELDTSRGTRSFATGDRLLFLRNERSLGVKNGTLGWVEYAGKRRMVVRTDDGKRVTFNPLDYQDLDHGYAVTVHKSQGVTVDRAYVLATKGFDRHLAYVALSRHRSEVSMVYSREAFTDAAGLEAVLGRQRAKDTTLDFADALRETRGFEQSENSPPTDHERRGRPRARDAAWMERLLEEARRRARESGRDGPSR